MMASETLKILVIDESETRADILLEGLRDAGYTDVHHFIEMGNLIERITALDPDVILIDLENPNRDTVEQMFRVSREVKRPIAMFVDESDSQTTSDAIKAGVSAYVIDGLRRDRIKPIVEVSISRFQAFNDLQRRADDAEQQLAERKVIERAKAMLIRKRGIGEPQAYDAIRDMARKRGKRMVEVAQNLLDAAELGL